MSTAKFSATIAELFLLEGQGPKVVSMANDFQKEDDMRTVKLVTV